MSELIRESKFVRIKDHFLKNFYRLTIFIFILNQINEVCAIDLSSITRDPNAPYKRVVFIGLDGVGMEYKKVSTPNLDTFQFIQSEVSAQFPTFSAENWGSMIHGVTPDKHGLNNIIVEIQQYDENSPYPSIFKIIQSTHQGTDTSQLASFSSWGAINKGIIERSVVAEEYSPEINESLATRLDLLYKLYVKKDPQYDPYIVSHVIEYVEDPNNKDVELLFIHLGGVDETGHAFGWGSEQYLDHLKLTDERVGEILRATEDAGWNNDTLFIVTTDHGGVGIGHGGYSDAERIVFLGLKGNGIDVTKIPEQDITNMDCGAITLAALGIDIPSWFDSKVPLGLFA